MIRVLVKACLVVGLAGLVAGCGSDPEPDSATMQPDAVEAASDASVIVVLYDDEIRSTTETVVALHGEKTGLLSVLAALERGYDFGQIREGADSGGLGADGIIEAAEPNDGRAGVVELDGDPEPGEGAWSASEDGAGPRPVASYRQDPPPQSLDSLASLLTPLDVQLRDLNDDSTGDVDPGHALIGAILSLGRSGYTLDQIVEALVLGSGGVHVLDNGCAVINPLSPVQPKGSYNSGCIDGADNLDTDDEDDSAGEESGEQDDAAAAAVGSVAFVGSVTQGSFDSTSDNLITITYEALIEGDTVVLVADYSEHIWLRGGPDENYPDQNCGVTQVLQVRGEGPAGSPTTIFLQVVSSELVDFHGALCFDRALGEHEKTPIDVSFYERDPGSNGGRFQGQANGLGVDGLLKKVPIQSNVPQ